MTSRNSATTLGRIALCVALVAVFAAVPLLAGCSKGSSAGKGGASEGSIEVTQGVSFNKTTPAAPVEPAPPMLRNPKTSVYSYLLWISYAYRILNSDVATMAFSVNEEVRVNSYVELNREQGQAIDQRLLGITYKDVSIKDDTATVSASEDWAYRYIDIKTGKYSSDVLKASYDTTYTVISTSPVGPRKAGTPESAKRVWLVDDVIATARGKVK